MTDPVTTLPEPKAGVQQKAGVPYAQAMEVGRRFFEESDAAPTIAHEMGIEYETVCAVLGGRLWPGVRQFWMDRVFP
jgi:hypothetical protein